MPKSTTATCELVECSWTSTALNSREARECLTPDADSSARCSCDTIESDSILTCRSRQGSQVRVCQRRIAAAGVSVVWLARQPSDRGKPHWAVDSKRRTLFVWSGGLVRTYTELKAAGTWDVQVDLERLVYTRDGKRSEECLQSSLDPANRAKAVKETDKRIRIGFSPERARHLFEK